MDLSNNSSRKHRHDLVGVKSIDGVFYVSLSEIVRFCKRFALYRGKELASVIERSLNELEINKAKQMDIPIIDTKKSFLGRLFD